GSTNVSSDGLTPGQLYAKCVDSVVAITVEVVSSQGELYEGYNIKRIGANRMINSKGSKRGRVTELLISNF
ncbi:MAG: hypothetical protein IIV59_08370, partial [Selenomonadaceae bacterium]|nr:hypothetical protein [Selenomonadaceae bacterium]